MTDHELVQELQKCADRHRTIRNNRIKVEYRVLITTLTFYVAATFSILKSEIDLSIFARATLTIAYFLLALLTSRLLFSIHSSNRTNIFISENYENEILKHLNLTENPIPSKLQRKDYNAIPKMSLHNSNWGWQSFGVLCFAFVSIILIICK